MLDVILLLLAAIAVVLIGAAIYASTLPDAFEVRRSMEIAAPIEKVFEMINDLKRMNAWNPFVLRAPHQGAYSGPASGPGAIYDFDGKKSGTGRLQVTEAVQPREVRMRLVMTKPMACDNQVLFTLEPAGDRTRVTWLMRGNSPLFAKMMGLVVNCDKMVGNTFDEGLTTLKTMAEAT